MSWSSEIPLAKDRARTHEFFAMKWNPETAVVFTPDEIAQAARCAKGEHEAEFKIFPFASQSLDEESKLGEAIADSLHVHFINLSDDSQPEVSVCRHCRCLFVER